MRDAARTPAILPEGAAAATFDANCRACPRLASFLDQVRANHPAYCCAPVAPFGDDSAALVVVGLAPGMHGANATGRPFTGDHAGILLYATLHAYGFASQPVARARDDGLALIDCRITNAVKCLPPLNKPAPDEIARCNHFLAADLARLPAGGAVLALGRIAHTSVLRAFGMRPAALAFEHGARHPLAQGAALFDSYHCSRYNTNTRRLTPQMFREVFEQISAHLARTRGRRAEVRR